MCDSGKSRPELWGTAKGTQRMIALISSKDVQTEFYSHKKFDLVITVFSPGISEYMPVYHMVIWCTR
jgi:hypothetical protein